MIKLIKMRACVKPPPTGNILVLAVLRLGSCITGPHVPRNGGVFLAVFYFFISFFIKKYFCFRNLQEYIPAAPLLGGRVFSAKKIAENLLPGPWRTGRPAAGRPAPQAARQRGGRIWPPGCGATTSHSLLKGLPPSFGSKIPGKKYSVRRNTIYTPYHGLTVH